MKRLLDLFFSWGFLIILTVPLLPIALLLRITGEGQIFYLQKRVGKHGQVFGLFKFATMLKDSPNLPGGDITMGNRDPRILPFGNILRTTKINEIPQLINILKGELSIVGPRPLTPRNFGYYTEETQNTIKKMTPGLTGIGSIVFRDEASIIDNSPKDAHMCYKEDIAPYKGELEVWYYKNCSMLIDLKLIFLTAWIIFFPKSRLYENVLCNLPTRPNFLEN